MGNSGISGADGNEDEPPGRLGRLDHGACAPLYLLPRISICGARCTRCTATIATAPLRTHMRCRMHLGLHSPSIVSILLIQFSVTGGGRGRDSRLETRRAQARAQVFPRAMTSAVQIQACKYVSGKENSTSHMINLAMARQLASLRRGRPRTRNTSQASTVCGRQPAKCATSVPRLKCN